MRLQRGPPKAAPAGPPQKPGGVRGFRLRRDRFGLFSALFGSSVLVGVIKVPGFSLRKCGNTGHGTAEEHAFGFLLNTSRRRIYLGHSPLRGKGTVQRHPLASGRKAFLLDIGKIYFPI